MEFPFNYQPIAILISEIAKRVVCEHNYSYLLIINKTFKIISDNIVIITIIIMLIRIIDWEYTCKTHQFLNNILILIDLCASYTVISCLYVFTFRSDDGCR